LTKLKPKSKRNLLEDPDDSQLDEEEKVPAPKSKKTLDKKKSKRAADADED